MHSHASKNTKSVNISKMNLKTKIFGKPCLWEKAIYGEINWNIWAQEMITIMIITHVIGNYKKINKTFVHGNNIRVKWLKE